MFKNLSNTTGLRILGLHGLANRIDRQFDGGIFSSLSSAVQAGLSSGPALSGVILPAAMATYGIGEQTGINDAIRNTISDFISK